MSESSLEDYTYFENEPAPETVVKREWQPLWKPSSEKSEPKGIVSGGPAPVGSCEFVGGLVYQGALCRKCTVSGDSACFFFADAAVYASCPTRMEKLREKA